MEYTRQETMAWHESLFAFHEHNNRRMQHALEEMAAGKVPQLQPAPSPPPQPVLLTFEEFLAQNSSPSPGTGGSTVGGGAGLGTTPESRSPITPIHGGGGDGGGGLGGSAAASSDDLGFGGLGSDDLGSARRPSA
nr:loricrin-like [Aegilops tauschii subsp. strangulata]